ncbi:MAG: WecB/TagA/CpsF family glycosyltransferase [Candidatus Shapirobacteria bacterium]
MRQRVLGAPVDLMKKPEFIDVVSGWIEGRAKMKLIVTAYSEFFVLARRDPEFMGILQSADLVTPDGVSVLAAVKYAERSRGMTWLGRLGQGIRVGVEILSGKVGEPVTGVWLFENLTRLAAERGWKVFLLGGWNNVSARTVKMLLKRLPGLKIEYDEGEARVGTDETKNKEVIERINRFRPDILFVAYNPIKQEKWLAKHRGILKVKVGVGVGGTFDEFTGEFKKAPLWMEKAGLKWLFRVIREPKRIKRILKAVVVFPWLVFRNSRS